MKPDLKAAPFRLTDEQIGWVHGTLASMTDEEKIGQLFCPISYSSDENYLRYNLLNYHVGGLLFKTSPSREVRDALEFMQTNSRIPLLCAANLEFGSTGYLEDGTMFGQQMAIGAAGDPKCFCTRERSGSQLAQSHSQRAFLRQGSGCGAGNVQSL